LEKKENAQVSYIFCPNDIDTENKTIQITCRLRGCEMELS